MNFKITPLVQRLLDKEITEAEFVEETKKLPVNQAVEEIKIYGYAISDGMITQFFKDFSVRYPDYVKDLKDRIKITRVVPESKTPTEEHNGES